MRGSMMNYLPTRCLFSTVYMLRQYMEPNHYDDIMTTITLTFEYEHIHPCLFSIQRLLSTGPSHPDNTSLMLAIRSIELARYLSGIMPIVLLFSSSSCCTRVNVSPNSRSLWHTSASLYSPQWGPEGDDQGKYKIVKHIRTYYSSPCHHSGSTRLRMRSNNPA